MRRVACLLTLVLFGCETTDVPMLSEQRQAFEEEVEANTVIYVPQRYEDEDLEFVVVYDSFARSLTNVRAEAEERCTELDRATILIGREMAGRIQKAYFVCPVP